MRTPENCHATAALQPAVLAASAVGRAGLLALMPLFAGLAPTRPAPAQGSNSPGVSPAGLAAPVVPVTNGYWYGTGCGGQAGLPATVTVSPALRPGFGSQLTVSNLPPATAAMILFGFAADQWLGLPLPLPLGSFGLTGCELLVPPDLTILFSTGNGTVVANIGVPLLPALAARSLFAQVAFDQATANPVGVGYSRGYATRIAPMPSPTSMVSSITQFGITFQFAQPVEAGRFVNGDWFVVGPAILTGIDPPCTVVGGRVLNGAMINPDPSTQNHGYDSSLFDPVNYNHSRNVAWNLSPANPRLLLPDQSLIKVISNTNTTLLPVLLTCSVLTVVDVVPPQGSFRPQYAGADHVVRHDVQMIDWSRLSSLVPAAGMPDIVEWTDKFERPWLDHAPGWPTRYMHPIDNMPDYGRDFATVYNEGALLCNCAIPMVQKQELAIRLVQIGIDCFGNVEGGAIWEGLGGHGSGRKLPILFAGALLGDDELLAVGVNYPSGRHLNGSFVMHFGEDCQTFYVQQTSPTEINWGYGNYTAAHLGTPEYGFSHAHYPDNDTVAWQTSYRQCCTANAWIGAVLCAHVMGLVDEWHHPALFDYTDRFAVTEPAGWTRSWSTWVGSMWDQYRSQY